MFIFLYENASTLHYECNCMRLRRRDLGELNKRLCVQTLRYANCSLESSQCKKPQRPTNSLTSVKGNTDDIYLHEEMSYCSWNVKAVSNILWRMVHIDFELIHRGRNKNKTANRRSIRDGMMSGSTFIFLLRDLVNSSNWPRQRLLLSCLQARVWKALPLYTVNLTFVLVRHYTHMPLFLWH